MITATKNWLRRNRTNFAIGFGVLGVGYAAGQYTLSKITEAGERMNNERTAKENLRRRFQQNQEDCTITVQALLPTATENVLEALPVESITHELQAKKAERLGRIGPPTDIAVTEQGSGPASVTDEDGKSLVSFQSESYVHASQVGEASSRAGDPITPSSAKTKAQLWNDLKINSITRSFTLLYTLALLTLLTRIQLNLLGRRNYLSSVVLSASHSAQDSRISLENRDDDHLEQNYGNDFETNRKFLTFSWWLLHRGWKDMQEKVQAAVIEVFGPLNPREDIGLEQLSNLILDVRRIVEGATPEQRKNRTWLTYLLPPRDQEDFVLQESGIYSPPIRAPQPTLIPTTTIPPPSPSPSPSPSPIAIPHQSSTSTTPTTTSPSLRRLLDETSDIIDSPLFSQILTPLLDTIFSHLTDHHLHSQAFKLPLSLSPPSRIQSEIPLPLPSPKAKLATILAVITRQAHVIGSGSASGIIPNEYIQAMDAVPDLEAFAAVVYSSNYELEVIAHDISNENPRKEIIDHHRAAASRNPNSATTTTAATRARSSRTPRENDNDNDNDTDNKSQTAAEEERRSSEQENSGSGPLLSNPAIGIFENVWGRVVG